MSGSHDKGGLYGHITPRVPTSSGNHGKPGKSPNKVPYMEKSWNSKKNLNSHGKIM